MFGPKLQSSLPLEVGGGGVILGDLEGGGGVRHDHALAQVDLLLVSAAAASFGGHGGEEV